MHFADYVEELAELSAYLEGQIDLPDMSSLFPFVLGVAVLVAVLIMISVVLRSRRAVKEYIDEGVCLRIQIPPMGDVANIIREMLVELYRNFFPLYKSKYYFVIEILLKRGQQDLFVFLPKKIYERSLSDFCKGCDVELVTEAREKFVDNLGEEIFGLEFELREDYVYPLEVTADKESRQKLEGSLGEGEWIFLQLACRPMDEKWARGVERYVQSLEMGKEPSKGLFGCAGSFIGIIAPFFTLLGDMLTYAIHGAGKDKAESNLGPEIKNKLQRISEKKVGLGFETALKVLVSGADVERAYLLSDAFLDCITPGGEKGNYFVVSRMHKRVKSGLKNSVFLADMPKNSVDILNTEEIAAFSGLFF